MTLADVICFGKSTLFRIQINSKMEQIFINLNRKKLSNKPIEIRNRILILISYLKSRVEILLFVMDNALKMFNQFFKISSWTKHKKTFKFGRASSHILKSFLDEKRCNLIHKTIMRPVHANLLKYSLSVNFIEAIDMCYLITYNIKLYSWFRNTKFEALSS